MFGVKQFRQKVKTEVELLLSDGTDMSFMPRNDAMTSGPISPAEASAMSTRGRTMCRWALALVVAGAFLAAIGSDVVSPTHAARNIPPIAEPMYLSAYASVITGRAGDAVRPLNHLASVDPTLADVQNALALAIFTANPGRHRLAFAHAERAVELAPDVPQFVVTYVLTDRRNWRLESDGTARLTRTAVRKLRAAASKLVKLRSNARTLGALLATFEETGEDAEFPFVFHGYAQLVANPRLAFTRPSERSFASAQQALAKAINGRSLKK